MYNLSRLSVVAPPGCRAMGQATQTIKPKRRLMVPNKHWNPLFARERAKRYMKIDLVDFEFDRRRVRDEVTPDEMKERMKKMGIEPSTPYQEKPFYIGSTGAILDEYVPVEGDGKASLISREGGKQAVDFAKGKGKTMSSVRKIRKYDEDFDPRTFVDEALEIYKAAHDCLARNEDELLHKYATEKAYPEMRFQTKRKTIHWKFIKSLEPPKVVHARHAEIVSKENMFGQVTVRFHTQQVLAVYDRFGRLIHGSEVVAKDVLEYVVFEKHLSNIYGLWRLHSKIVPDWLPAREPGRLTFRMPKEEPKKEEEAKTESKEVVSEEQEEEPQRESLLDRFGRVIGRK